MSLTQQILIGLVVGGLIGWLLPEFAVQTKFLRDIFLNLIKSIIAPLVFATIVVGIAGGGSLKQVGRMGAKALLYFEVVTTLALAVGLLVVNWTQPGVGVVLTGQDTSSLGAVAENHPKTLIETLVHIFPSSIFDAMVRGDVLQIVAFSVVFAMAVSAAGERGKVVLGWCESLSQVMFAFTGFVMRFAPFGVGAAMAVTIGHMGPAVLINLGKLIGSLYLALALFVLVVLLPIALLARVPLKAFIRMVREPATIAFATTSSESALPKALEGLVRLGVPRPIAGFVLPTGYSFNLDGSTLYLAMASVFVAQAAEATTGVHFGIEQQLSLMVTLMITSKGIAAVPRASLVVLLAALHSFGLPPEGVVVIFAVDELMDMARTAINVVGNCLATVVVARWEGRFDDARAQVYGTPAEVFDERADGEPVLARVAAEDMAA